ncbi:protein-L-isoaspartate O-methyltransferase family protein [Sorangium sp. So ce1099]|uniref:protein-L-isoaspartate O-methyltransferase family protein n=1 Tax=Sorangium sp. So ce1099 TaxID=3133331 RepID=UPI003F631981
MPSPTSTEPRAAVASLAALAVRYDDRRPDRWAPVPEQLDAIIAHDVDLAEAGRVARAPLVAELARRFEFPAHYLDAILLVPRERFVLPEDLAASADDTPLPLDRAGHATVSAPHAYLLTYGLLGLVPGDRLLELGTGTGYGAALARRILGPTGHVTSIEIDPALHVRAARLLGARPDPRGDDGAFACSGAGPSHEGASVTLLCGDGRSLAERVLAVDRTLPSERPWKVAVTYALTAPPAALEDQLADGSVLVAPVGPWEGHQELMRVERRQGALLREVHGAVRYVAERGRG